ncbi:TonB-dependent receptor [Caulobacter vibrioides]|nr:TonB-dependent receptor [Caulobacter vibrioides]
MSFKRASQRSLLLTTTVIGTWSLAAMAMAADLSGRVIDATGARALQAAEVSIVELGRTAQTESDGGFRFGSLPAGQYTLRTRYTGAATIDTPVTLGEDNARVTITLRPESADAVDSVLVVGQRANLASSISRQRAGEGIQSVLTRDAMGQFPDQNVAEAVRRAPGVNVLNDQGEGRFVAVRGLDPNLNAASINGVRVPSPEADVRSVALDVIPSELIESIEIKKTLTPDMDADTIGASIEINTTSAFDRKKPFFAVSAEGSYNEKTGKTTPKASVDFSRTFGDRLGVAGGLSYYKRTFATDNIEADDWEEADNGVVSAKTLEYRDYDVTRKRLGGSLSFDFRATDDTTLYLRLLASQFDDHEYRRRTIFEMEGDPVSGTATSASFRSQDGRITVIRDLKDRFESQTIRSLSFGGRTDKGPWRFDYSAAYSAAREKEAGSIDPARFRQRFTGSSLGVNFDYSDMENPAYSITTGQANFLNASRYSFYRLEQTSLSMSKDDEATLKFDARRAFPWAGGNAEVQFGAKARLREKSNDLQIDYYSGYNGTFTLADVLGTQDYGLADISPVVGKTSIAQFLETNSGKLVRSDFDTAYESSIADYKVAEDILSAYALGRYQSGPLRAVAGLRVEHTRNRLQGNFVEVDGDDLSVAPNSFKRDYTDWLPSATIRYEAKPNLLVRAGAFRSVVRPGIGKIAPRFVVEDNEGEFGNPNLKPYDAWNFDLSTEWYFAKEAVLSGGVFYKKVKNFIVDAEYEDYTFNGVTYDQVVTPINGDEATIKGFEFNYQQALTFLPGLASGTILGFNYTYTDAEGDVDGRTISLPASSKNTFNAMVGYEKGPFSVRLSATYRDLYLDELGSSAEKDRWVKDHLQYDLSAKYRVTKQIQVFADLVNMGDEPYVAYQRGPKGDRLLQYEEYSWTGKFGLKATF